MMLLIAGLGNPEKKYEKTRHNVGFMAIDALASNLGISWKEDKKRNALVAEHTHTFSNQKKKVRMVLVKPLTYMNKSGYAIQKIAKFYKIKTKNIWVIHDDLDIELGSIRIRLGGSSAGQKGVQSIIENVGSNFYRFRIGIKTEKLKEIQPEKFVLTNFSLKEKNIVKNEISELVIKLINYFEEDIKNSTLQNSKKRPRGK